MFDQRTFYHARCDAGCARLLPHPEDEEPLLLESPDLAPVAGYLAAIGWTLRGDRLTCPQHST